MISDKIIFRGVIVYLPFSIFFIFWLYLVSLMYGIDEWQYQLFFGKDGNIALIWLFLVLLPALLFLVLKLKQKTSYGRFLGAAGFYCLLGSLISKHVLLAFPGLILIFASILVNRRFK